MNRLKKFVGIMLCLMLCVSLCFSALADSVMPKMPEPPQTPVYWQLAGVSIEPTVNATGGYEVSYGDENISVPLDDRLMTESLLESGEIAAPSLRISASRKSNTLEQTYSWSAMPVYLEPGTSYEVNFTSESMSTSDTLDSWMGVYLQGESVGRLSAGGYNDRPSTFTLTLNPSETELFADGSMNVSFVLRDANDMLRIRVLYAYEMADGQRPYPTPIPGFVASEEAPDSVPSFYVPVEGKDGLWTISTAPGEYRAYGFMNGEGPAFFAADENGNVEMNAPAIAESEDYASHVEGFYPFPMEGEVPQGYTKLGDSLYSFTTKDGEVMYRAFGRMNGNEPAFFAADENGNVASDAAACDPAGDYTQYMEGFGASEAAEVPAYYQANENGVYSFTDREGNVHYRVYGRMNGNEPAFYEADENGAVAAGAAAIHPAADFASYIEGFDTKQPEAIPEHYQQVGDGLYSFTTKDGETVYRVYGVLDGQAPAFYPADETGKMISEEAASPEADFETYFRGFEKADPGEMLPSFYTATETEGVWSFTDSDGNVQYRTYGSKDRGGEAFYPCDAEGNVLTEALPVEAAADLATLPVPVLTPAVPEGDQVVDFYTLIDAEKGLYAFTGKDGQTENRIFGAQENGEAAYYACDENGTVLPGNQPIDPQTDYENHIAGFEMKTPEAQTLPATYEILRDGLYAYQNEEGETVYRAYGSLNRGEPAFYPANEAGEVSTDAEPVDVQKENENVSVSHEVVAAEGETQEPETVERTYPLDNSVAASAEGAQEPVAVDEAVTEEPATEEPATEEPATEAPATEEPATEAPATEEPATEEPATEEPATEAPAVTETPAAEPTAEAAETEEEKEHWIWILIGAAAAALGVGGGTVAALKKKAKKK